MAFVAVVTKVRYELLRQIKKAAPDVRIHTCYGVETSQRRRQRALPKSHTNDAVSKGKVSIRRGRPQIKPGSLVEVNGEILQVHGTHRKDHKLKNGMISTSINVEFASPARGGKKSASLRKCKLIKPSYNTGWIKI